MITRAMQYLVLVVALLAATFVVDLGILFMLVLVVNK